MRTIGDLLRVPRAPAWVIGLVIVAQIAGDAFINLVVFRHHWLVPLYNATGGLLNVTFGANLVMLVMVVGGMIFGLARVSPADVGLRVADISPALLFSMSLWAIVNGAVLCDTLWRSVPLALDPGWAKPAVNVGRLIGQLFGNALYEEIVYRGFLTIQVMLLLMRQLPRTPALLIAVVAVQAIFAAIHVPMLIVTGNSWPAILSIMPTLFLASLMLAAIYLVTGNLLVAVGVHALSDAFMLISPDSVGLGNFPYLVLGLAGALIWRLCAHPYRAFSSA
ncbi:MAG TPA: CPBP family intramembrane glutamic endopeptidase [Rhizomicrobium sp.]|jgi:hypothetical protein|nr:CPBP family intramembrane glutamic endopeptidase [Rhizomicrobium sp.]